MSELSKKELLAQLLQELSPKELKELGLQKNKLKKGKWSQDEIDFISEFIPTNGIQYCAEQLNRSVISVQKKWNELLQGGEDDSKLKVTKKRGIVQSNRPNLFQDYVPDKKETKILQEDSKIDKVLSKHRPTIRITRPSSLIKLRCRGCGRDYKVSNKIVTREMVVDNRWKCNKCIVGK